MTEPVERMDFASAIYVEQNSTECDTGEADEVDMKIASMLIESPSLTDNEIAGTLGIGRQTVNRRRNSKAVQEMVREVISIPERDIRRLSAKALRRLEAMLDDDDPRIRLSVCLAFLRLSSGLITSPFFGKDSHRF